MAANLRPAVATAVRQRSRHRAAEPGERFEDNEAACAAVGLDGAEVSLVLVVPPASAVIPEQLPGRTAAGNVSLKKITQAAKADFYQHFVCGQILVTLREAFAVAPGLISARLVALRNDGRDVYGQPTMPCLAAVNVAREALNGVRWNDADAVDILNADAGTCLAPPTGLVGVCAHRPVP